MHYGVETGLPEAVVKIVQTPSIVEVRQARRLFEHRWREAGVSRTDIRAESRNMTQLAGQPKSAVVVWAEHEVIHTTPGTGEQAFPPLQELRKHF